MKLGLTGGIGCGKSTVVERFREAGWLTIESDAVVRDLLCNDLALVETLKKRWGDRCVAASGSIDRKAVGHIVFSDSAELKWLEKQLHPRVRKVWQQQVAENHDRNTLVEIPLLFEKSLESEFDFTVCVHSPEAIVDSRMEARGFTREELARRRSHQLPIEEKIRRADFVVTNAGNLEFLNQQIARLLSSFRA